MPLQRIPLAQPIESRDGTFGKDSYTTNYIFQIRNQKKEVVKRPGLALIQNILSYTGTTGAPTNGLRDFNGKLIAIVNGDVRQVVPGVSATSLGNLSSNDARCYMTKSSLDSYLVFHNTDNLYVVNSAGTFAKISGGAISYFKVNLGGTSYYSNAATLNITPTSGGSGLAGTIVWEGQYGAGYVDSVTLTNRGSGYLAEPVVSITPGSTFTRTATGSSGAFTITNTGATWPVLFGTGTNVTGCVASGTGLTTGANAPRVSSVVGTTINLSQPNAGAVSGTITFTDTGTGASINAILTNVPEGPYVAGCVYLDNYVFVGIAASNRIYNSSLGDPTLWNSLNYVTFEQTNDQLVAIAKHINYLIAFGQKSTQFFYDAANATGSPLALASSYTSEIGCASGDSIVSTSNTVLWISTSASYGRSVSMMEGVVAKRISTDYIDRHLLASNLTNVKAFAYTHSGHTLYILTLTDIGQTLVYDLTIGEWYSWTQFGTQTTPEASVGTTSEYYFRPGFGAVLNGVPYCLDSYNSKLYQLSTTTYQDDSQPMYCRTVTDLADNGTTKRKFYGRLELIGDKVAGGTMFVSHTGNDYKDYSYSRAVNLNADRAQVYQCGADRRRAWQFLSTSNVPLRLQSVEIDFDIGEMDPTQNVGGGQ